MGRTTITFAQDNGELLYCTGFEDGTKIVPIHPEDSTGDDDLIEAVTVQKLTGIDGMKFYYEGGDASMRFARIVPENGKPSNSILHFWANKANAKNFSKTRIQADLKGMTMGLREFYQSMRLFLPEDMALLTDYPSVIAWLTIMEVWNNAPLKPFPFRVTVGINKYVKGKGELYFHVDAQNIDQTDVKKPKFITIWTNLSTQFPVPFGKWMTLEYYLAEGDSRSGRFFMAVTPENGARTVLFDITNATHHTKDPSPDGFTGWNPMKLYTSRQVTDYMRGKGKALEAFWDDLSIWKNRKP